MERIKASEMKGANAYFTNFDNRIVAKAANVEALKRSTERVLKILLLTKNNVVCAASHLVNDVAFDIFQSNPILLQEKMVVPAFVEDKNDIEELFESRRMKDDKKKRYVDFYKQNVRKTVSWNIEENSNWFRDAFVEGLMTENSVIRNNLRNLDNSEISRIAEEVKSQKKFSRNIIEQLCVDYDAETQKVLRNYRELMYHISGARVVNCESTLPQENYIRYSLADIENRRILLSDVQVFIKIYIELLLETLHKPSLSDSALDVLTFDDIALIRKPILESDFISKYEYLYQQSFDALEKENEDDLLYSFHDLLVLRQELEESFKKVFSDELKNYLTRKMKRSATAAVKSTADLVLNMTKIGKITALTGTRSEFMNIQQVFWDRKAMKKYDEYTRHKAEQLTNYIFRYNIHGGSEFIDTFNLLMDTISQKYAI